MSTSECPSVVEGAITELDTGRSIRRDWYLNVGAHEGFIEDESFQVILKGDVDIYHADTG